MLIAFYHGGIASKLYGILITTYDLGQKAPYAALLKDVRALADKPAGDSGQKPAPTEKSKQEDKNI